MTKIRIVARFEMKTLLRSWFFRIFSILTLLMLLGMNIGMLTEGGSVSWAVRSITSNIPYMNVAFLNIAQALLAVFLASDFLKRDKKLDTTEVIYTRSMTNWEYVWGKTFGVVIVFMILNLLVLTMALIINLVISGVTLNLTAYLLYPILIGLPTLLFTLGLAFFLMSVIRNQAVTLVVLLGLAAVSLFFIQDKVNHLFDYMAFTFPMMWSDMIGSGNIENILLHRGIYFFIGLGLIFATVLLLKRLPQSRPFSVLSVILMVGFLVLGFGSGYVYWKNDADKKELRVAIRELNDQIHDHPVVRVDHHSIEIIHDGDQIKGIASLQMAEQINDLSGQMIFSLNPALILNRLSIEGQEIDFDREQHLIKFTKPSQAVPGSVIVFEYAGKIDERICYLDVPDEDLRIKHGPNFIIGSPKRHAILEPGYVLLTPESMWYPIPGGTFGTHLSVAPQRQFSQFTLTVQTDPALTPISQGTGVQQEDTWMFTSTDPYPGISLTIGQFETRTLDLDSLRVELSYYPGHGSFIETLGLLSDTLPTLVRETFGDYRRSLGLSYPFDFLKLVESPVQFYAYDRVWARTNDYVQPGMVFYPENLIWFNRGDVKKELEQTIDRSIERDEAATDADLQARVFTNLVRNNLLQSENNFRMIMRGSTASFSYSNRTPWSLFANYYAYVNYFESDRYPMLNAALEAYIGSQTGQQGGFGRSMNQGVTDEEKANLALKEQSFFDLLNAPDEKGILPVVIEAKGKQLFNYLEASIGSEAFIAYITRELNASRFDNRPFEDLVHRMEETFGLHVSDYLETWYYGTEVPSFLVTDVQNYEIQEGDHTIYQIFYTISNTGDAEGVVNISFRTGGRGGPGRGGFGMRGGMSQQTYVLAGRDESTDKLVMIPSKTAYRFAMLLDDPARMMTVNTLISSNLPSLIMYPFPNVEQRKMEAVEGVFDAALVTTLSLPHELIVDNEDPGFQIHEEGSSNKLSGLLGIDQKESEFRYQGMNFWRPPMSWTLTTSSGYYGDYIRSAHYTRSGEGERYVEWEVQIEEPGYYDVAAYLDDMVARVGRFRGRGGDRGGSGGSNDIKDVYHYIVYHDEGEEEVAKALSNIEDGWNMLGSFYFSAGTAKVQLTNKNSGRLVVADAIRWIKQN